MRRRRAEDVQDLMVATVEHRYGQVNRVPEPIEWLTDNGSCYTARDTRALVLPLTPKGEQVKREYEGRIVAREAKMLKNILRPDAVP